MNSAKSSAPNEAYPRRILFFFGGRKFMMRSWFITIGADGVLAMIMVNIAIFTCSGTMGLIIALLMISSALTREGYHRFNIRPSGEELVAISSISSEHKKEVKDTSKTIWLGIIMCIVSTVISDIQSIPLFVELMHEKFSTVFM
ncbi:hypothetical protein ACT3RR_14885 [Ewingella sp. AOP8-B2-18]